MRAPRPLALGMSAWLWATAASAADHPDTPPPQEGALESTYERDTLRQALAVRAAKTDESPEGKYVEAIDIEVLDVIENRDPAPNFLNVFHVRSKRWVIEREVLLKQGDRYHQRLADETARNLRLLPQTSAVIVVPLVGSAADRVRLLVVVKDIWSLRLSSDYRFTGQGLEYLFLAPTEISLGGVHHALGLQFTYLPQTVSFGYRYSVPRIALSRMALRSEAALTFNLESGALEGSNGVFQYGQPLYRIDTEWGWGATVTWRQEITRTYQGREVATYDAESTPEVEQIPFRWRTDVFTGQLQATRSFGRRYKLNLGFGLDASRRNYAVDPAPGASPEAMAEFRTRWMPVSDQRVAPWVEARTFENRFARLVDHETLVLGEDLRLGHDVYARFYPAAHALFSSRDVIGTAAGALYTLPIGDGFVRGYVETVNEFQPDKLADGSVLAGLRFTSPRLGFGRIVADGVFLHRYANYLNRLTAIGGEGRLRGYASQKFIGKDVVAANLEVRTAAIEFLNVALAGVLFWDAGHAADGLENLRLKQSVGAGVRVLLPQLNRFVIRADWGFPLDPTNDDKDDIPGEFVVTFEQAFSIPTIGR